MNTGGTLLKGGDLAAAIKARVAARVQDWTERGLRPKLAVVAATDDPAALKYEETKRRNAEKLGIAYEVAALDPSVESAELHGRLDGFAADPDVHGILLSLPLPRHLDTEAALDRIPIVKDVDGITAANLGRLASGFEDHAMPAATPFACIRLIEAHLPLEGAKVTLVGRGRTIGRALAPMLINRNATVTVCHTRTRDLKAEVRAADIVIAAAGRAGLVTADMVRPGQTIIDAAMNVGEGGRMVGDAQTEEIAAKGVHISPVPGGVGPVTSAQIFDNLLRAVDFQHSREAGGPSAQEVTP
ncbi:MAG: bifunctional 5,10-methylenetetrahydrofolate dehydrogenase/5,10-methenyltetrahydrofolate cyclohydrolase [Alphaproteobacteria bacterium]